MEQYGIKALNLTGVVGNKTHDEIYYLTDGGGNL